MERREEIARIIDPAAFNEDRPNLMNRDGRRLAARRTAQTILALDWTEPGLKRAVEIGHQHVDHLTSDQVVDARLLVTALEAEINGDDHD